MASQELKIWAEDIVIDALTSIAQRLTISPERFLSGWLRKDSVETQDLNQILNLLTIYSNPTTNAPVLYPTSLSIPDIALEMDGQAILEVDYPNAYSIYGSSLPDITGDAPTGFTYIIRKS